MCTIHEGGEMHTHPLAPPLVVVPSRLHIDEMRTLLELNYDAVHLQRWKDEQGKAPMRRSEFHVFHSPITAHRKRLCQRLTLPKDVKALLKIPKHEDDLSKLEDLRLVVLREIEGDDYVLLDELPKE